MSRVSRLAMLLVMLGASVTATANPCAFPYTEGGMGGTGIGQDGSGMGGTGQPAEGGMGGTGQVAQGGIGGTGQVAQGGIGGTGQVAQGGIGGTGQVAQGGIGGTGLIKDGSGTGGTGIVGVITGFGSICVNGAEIHYDDATPVTQDGQTSSTQHLAIGQWVSVEASGHGDSLHARSIALNSTLVGPVTRVGADGRSFEALGQTVLLDAQQMPFTGNSMQLPGVGDLVRVSGPRDQAGRVHATRLEQVPADTPLSIKGALVVGANGQGRIGEQPIAGVVPTLDGTEVRITGRLQGAVMRAERVDIKPDLQFSERVDRVLLQGLLHENRGDQVSIGYVRSEGGSARALTPSAQGEQWVRVQMTRSGEGRFSAQRVMLDRPVSQNRIEKEHGDAPLSQPRRSLDRDNGHAEGGRAHSAWPDKHRLDRPEYEKPEYEKPEYEKPEYEKPEFEKPEFEKPEFEKPEFEKPEFEKPEFEKPEFEKPEFEKPEFEKPEYEKPEYEKPEYEKPELPEVEH